MMNSQDSMNINPTNDVFLCALCGKTHLINTQFCEYFGKELSFSDRIPFEDTITCPFCKQLHQKELNYCPQAGRLMPILDSNNTEKTMEQILSITEDSGPLEEITADDLMAAVNKRKAKEKKLKKTIPVFEEKNTLLDYVEKNEELIRLKTNQTMMMIVIGVLLIAQIVSFFFIIRMSNDVSTLKITLNSFSELVMETYAKIQVLVP